MAVGLMTSFAQLELKLPNQRKRNRDRATTKKRQFANKEYHPDAICTTVYSPSKMHKQLKTAATDEEREMRPAIIAQYLRSAGRLNI